jgi:hypothetical protein
MLGNSGDFAYRVQDEGGPRKTLGGQGAGGRRQTPPTRIFPSGCTAREYTESFAPGLKSSGKRAGPGQSARQAARPPWPRPGRCGARTFSSAGGLIDWFFCARAHSAPRRLWRRSRKQDRRRATPMNERENRESLQSEQTNHAGRVGKSVRGGIAPSPNLYELRLLFTAL